MVEEARSSAPVLLEARGIKKSFNRVEVLHGVDFTLHAGEIHGLVGQNGAGKSTLMKIINGAYIKDEGTILVKGQETELGSPAIASKLGIAMVYQEFSLVPSMTVLQNLFLAREPLIGPFIDERTARKKAEEIFNELEVDINLDQELVRLSVGSRQIVEIVKALSLDASILILDEPTASLSSIEIEVLFKVIRRLKKAGVGIVFVSHHLKEVVEICDRVTVIRDGRVALSSNVSGLAIQDIITAMIGKKLDDSGHVFYNSIKRHHPLLQVRNLSAKGLLHDISFDLYPGEVLGIAGVLGSGRTELLKALYGILPLSAGDVRMQGEILRIRDPKEAIKAGIVMVPEDRRKNGLIAGDSIRNNVLLPIWDRLRRLLFIREDEGRAIAKSYMEDLKIRANSIDQYVEQLSGGNQQKVVFAKSLAANPRILLLDDPTVGVDIATKRDIALIIREIARSGNGVILVSSDMDEIASLCDRVLVLHDGTIMQELERTETVSFSEEMLMGAIQQKL